MLHHLLGVLRDINSPVAGVTSSSNVPRCSSKVSSHKLRAFYRRFRLRKREVMKPRGASELSGNNGDLDLELPVLAWEIQEFKRGGFKTQDTLPNSAPLSPLPIAQDYYLDINVRIWGIVNALFKACPQASSSNTGQKRSHHEGRSDNSKKKKQRQGEAANKPNDDGGSGRAPNRPDGLRFPKVGAEDPHDDKFGCPFHKRDPRRYGPCSVFRTRRISDVTQHIKRRHLLSRGDDHEYCPTCRIEFHHNYQSFADHVRQEACTLASIDDAGVLIPSEFQKLKDVLKDLESSSTLDKWQALWQELFNVPPPSTPYAEDIVTMIEAFYHRQAASTLPTTLELSSRRFGIHLDAERTLSVGSDVLGSAFRQSSSAIVAVAIDPAESFQQATTTSTAYTNLPLTHQPAAFINVPVTGSDNLVSSQLHQALYPIGDNNGPQQFVPVPTQGPIPQQGDVPGNLHGYIMLPQAFPTDGNINVEINVASLGNVPHDSTPNRIHEWNEHEWLSLPPSTHNP